MNQSIRSLVRSYQDQQLNSEELSELDELLRTDASAREIFIRETNLIAGIESVADEQHLGTGVGILRMQDSDNSINLANRWTMVTGWLVAALAASLLLAFFAVPSGKNQDKTIATVIGVDGPLQWTGSGGQVRSDLSVGMKLPGGTIDGISPDSWFSLRFDDGSVVVTSGNSMLAFSDLGQKVLHLKAGRLSADVTPQPDGSPMLIHTRSAILEIVGTSFDIDADLAATALNVTEGKVRVQRRSDGKLIDVSAQHQLIAAADKELSVSQIPKISHQWQSRLQDGPRRVHGRWLPRTANQDPMLGCLPVVTEKNKTIYSASFRVTVPDAAPVMTNKRTIINVNGRLDRPTNLYVGMTLKTSEGDFAGRFQVVLPSRAFQPDAPLNHSLEIEDFTLDPSLAAMADNLPSSANDLIVESIWCHTLYQQAGLAIASVELTEKSE